MTYFKKMGLAILCLLILFFLASNTHAIGLTIDSKAVILIDQRTGKVLYEKNSNQKLPIASTTKILTSILAIELAEFNEEIVVSEYVASIGESSIDLIAGEKITLQNLLLGTMIRSGNDAAVATAELVAGSEEEFVLLMNKKAKMLGAHDSKFSNPNGLPAKEHYSTASDLALIAKYAMDNPFFREIVSIKVATIPYADKNWNRFLKNTNKLLWKYAEANGIKTGTTDAAGPCLVASAQRGDTRLIAVILNSPNRFEESKKLLQWGLDNYLTVHKYKKGEYFTSINIPNSNPEFLDVYVSDNLVFTKNYIEVVSEEIRWYDINLPIAQGDIIGDIIVTVGNNKYKAQLKAATEVKKKSIWKKLTG